MGENPEAGRSLACSGDGRRPWWSRFRTRGESFQMLLQAGYTQVTCGLVISVLPAASTAT